MKKIVLLSFCFFCFLFCSCSVPVDFSDVTSAGDQLDSGEFSIEFVKESESKSYSDNDFMYYRDVVTDVMYLYCDGFQGGGLTVMFDPDTGKPLTYTRFQELQNLKQGDIQ